MPCATSILILSVESVLPVVTLILPGFCCGAPLAVFFLTSGPPFAVAIYIMAKQAPADGELAEQNLTCKSVVGAGKLEFGARLD